MDEPTTTMLQQLLIVEAKQLVTTATSLGLHTAEGIVTSTSETILKSFDRCSLDYDAT